MGWFDFAPVYQVSVKVQPVTSSTTGGPPTLAEGVEWTKAFVEYRMTLVNDIWRQAGVQFSFDRDVDLLPTVNSDALFEGNESATRALAQKYPRSVVLVWVSGDHGESGGTVDVVRVGEDFDPGQVAHEIGHFLHLQHTFTHGIKRVQSVMRNAEGATVAWEYVKNEQIFSAEEVIRAWVLGEASRLAGGGPPLKRIPEQVIRRGLTALDGDALGPHGVTDTAPHLNEMRDLTEDQIADLSVDPFFRLAINVRFNSAQEYTYYWQPDYNVESYWFSVLYQPDAMVPANFRTTISPQQAARARFVLGTGNRHRVVKAPFPSASGTHWAGWQPVGERVWSPESPGMAPLRDRVYLVWRASGEAAPPLAPGLVTSVSSRVLAVSLEDGPCFDLESMSEVQGGHATDCGIAAVSLDDRIYTLARGFDRRIYGNAAKWMTAFDDSWKPLGEGFETDVRPAAASLGARRYAFAVRRGSGTIHLSSALSLQPWGPWAEVQGGGRTDAAVAAASLKGRLYVAACGLDHRIYLNSAADGQPFGGWALVANSPAIDGAPALASDGTSLHLFARRESDQAIIRRQLVNTAGILFPMWQQMPLGPGLTSISPPTATSLPTAFGETMFVAIVGSDRRIHLNWTY